jgi:phasin family protein
VRRTKRAANPSTEEIDMFTTPEQLAQLQKSTFDTFQAVALKSFEGFEKLAELNLQAVKASVAESNEQLKTVLAVKDVKALSDLAAVNAQPNTEKATAYAKHVYEIANDTGTEIAKLIEKQFAESNKQLSAAIEALTKNAPAGSEGVVTFVKSAVTAANSAFDQVSKATKQVVEVAEANLAAATKTARPAGKKAA